MLCRARPVGGDRRGRLMQRSTGYGWGCLGGELPLPVSWRWRLPVETGPCATVRGAPPPRSDRRQLFDLRRADEAGAELCTKVAEMPRRAGPHARPGVGIAINTLLAPGPER